MLGDGTYGIAYYYISVFKNIPTNVFFSIRCCIGLAHSIYRMISTVVHFGPTILTLFSLWFYCLKTREDDDWLNL